MIMCLEGIGYLRSDLNILVINIYLSILIICISGLSIINIRINNIKSISYFCKTTFKDYYSIKTEVCISTTPKKLLEWYNKF